MFEFIQAHWKEIALAITTTYTFVVEAFSRISAALPAPTAESSSEYRWWFVFANNLARNPKRAENLAAIEQSPNFIPAAEAYMAKKLAEKAGSGGV